MEIQIKKILSFLEAWAHPSLQEPYDNAGLITGNAAWNCGGVLCCLDVTEEIVAEAVARNCNLIVAHHPIVFKGLKRINGENHVERTVIAAIKQDVAIYAIHTNLDNLLEGVNGRMGAKLGLEEVRILSPRQDSLRKLVTFVPLAQAAAVRDAIFLAGAGKIGEYDECSFTSEGTGTFCAGPGAAPFVGRIGERHEEAEIKMEMVFPAFLQSRIIGSLCSAHPYEEPAYDVIPLSNPHPAFGAGIIGVLPAKISEEAFLDLLKNSFSVPVIRHTARTGRPIQRVAICGGAGNFLITKALEAGVDAFVTADLKYHEFFEADGRLLMADVGHYESEQFTIGLLHDVLAKKFPNFAVLKTGVNTNPVRYF